MSGHLAVVRKTGTSQKVDDDTCLLQVPQVEEYSDVPVGSVLGIITLEDVIEELIQEEIIDETDIYVDIHKRIQVARLQKARRSHNNANFAERQVSKISNRSYDSQSYDELSMTDFIRSKSQPAMKDEQRHLQRHISDSLPEDNTEETTDETAALVHV